MDFNFTRIQENDFKRIDYLRHKYGVKMTAYSSQALYTWTDGMNLRVCVTDDSFFVSKDEHLYFYPVASIDKKREFIDFVRQDRDAQLIYMTQSQTAELEELFPNCFNILYSESDAEYIYNREQLVNHLGGKYERFRRKLNRIAADYSITSRPICTDDFPLMRDITHEWSEKRGTEQYGDTEAVLLSIECFSKLGMRGLIIEANGRPVGFIFGYESQNDTFTMSSMKMLPECHTNFSSVCIVHLAQSLGEYKFVNLEEDCGLEGIRYMKKLMQPVYLLGSYNALGIFR